MAPEEPQHERFGLLQFYPDGNSEYTDPKPRQPLPLETEFDIFAIHGLNGDREETWTYTFTGQDPDVTGGKKPKSRHGSHDLGKGDASRTDAHASKNVLWLRDFLRHDFPRARIYSIGYNSKVAGSYGTGQLDSFAREILINVQRTRQTEGDKKRPIIFICHSMGGLVVKKALVAHDAEVHYKGIIESTSAILFLGTPHGGSDYAAITKPLVNIANVVLPRAFGTFRKDLIGSLERNGPELLELSRHFRYIVDKENITLYSFVEQDRNPLLSKRIVDEASATIGAVAEEIIPLNGHHTQITRFASEESNNYAFVLMKLREHVTSLKRRNQHDFVPQITHQQATSDEGSPPPSDMQRGLSNPHPDLSPRSEGSSSNTNMIFPDQSKSLAAQSKLPYREIFARSGSALSFSDGYEGFDPRYSAASTTSSLTRMFFVDGKVSKQFVGRDHIMHRLDASLNVDNPSQARAALVGLGGAGKTEIAIAYAHQYKAKYPDHSVFWIHAASTDRMCQDFIAIADRLNLQDHKKSGVEKFELLNEWLHDSKNGSWLIILDNLDDLKTLSGLGKPCSCHAGEYSFLDHYLPQVPHGSILATTRTKQVGKRLVQRPSQLIEMGFMSESEALDLLRVKELKGSREVLLELAVQLECLPLAIIQAAAFITSNDMPVKRFITQLREGDEQLITILSKDPEYEFGGSGPMSSVAATWKLSFDQIWKQNPEATNVLANMIFFDRQRIPVEWLRRSTDNESGEHQIDFEGQLGVLKAFSLVSERSDTLAALEMHRLVQLMTRNWLVERGDAAFRALEAMGIMSRHFPSGDQGTWTECAENLPHALKILKDPLTSKNPLDRKSQLHRLRLRSKVARYLISQTRYLEAKLQTMLAFEELKTADDNFDEEIIQVEIEQVIILRKLGDFGDSEQLAQEVMKSSRKLLGKDHTLTWTAAECLLHSLRENAKYIEATKLAKASLEKRKKQLEESNPDVLVWVEGLAILLELQGKYHESEQYLRQSIQRRNADPKRGPAHLVTLKLNTRLARVLSAQGNFRKAEELYEKLIHNMEGTLGVEHHDKFKATFFRAQNLQRSRQYEQAESLFRGLLEKCYYHLGHNHPETWTVKLAIANVLQDIAQQTNPHRLLTSKKRES